MALADEWLAGAEKDLTSEMEYLYSEFGERVAEEIYAKLMDIVALLCDYPRMGKALEGEMFRDERIRVLNVGLLAIVYVVSDKVLLISAIWNSRRDNKGLYALLSNRWKDIPQQ